MKAIIIKTRQVVYVRLVGKSKRMYKDLHSGRVYPKHKLEFYEYYGG